MATAKEIAGWLLIEYQKFDRLYQNRIANQSRSHFGQEWVYRNKNVNFAIVKSVAYITNGRGDAQIYTSNRSKENDDVGQSDNVFFTSAE